MFRNRVRPPTPPLDDVTAERLLRGGPIDDLPDAFQPLGQLLADASGPATADELDGSAAAAAEFVTAHHTATKPRSRTWSLAASLVTALTVAASTGTAVAATQGALPEPIQQVAHEALGVVGISVPSIDQRARESGHENSVSTPASNVGVGGATVTTTTSAPGGATTGTPAAVVPSGTPTGADPGIGDGSTGNGNGNAYAGDGNSGNGNAYAGNGNSGNGNGGASGGDSGSGSTTDPSNLPPQSNGKGNGPPQVPPGQAKKGS
jgi:hypothetical protein